VQGVRAALRVTVRRAVRVRTAQVTQLWRAGGARTECPNQPSRSSASHCGVCPPIFASLQLHVRLRTQTRSREATNLRAVTPELVSCCQLLRTFLTNAP